MATVPVAVAAAVLADATAAATYAIGAAAEHVLSGICCCYIHDQHSIGHHRRSKCVKRRRAYENPTGAPLWIYCVRVENTRGSTMSKPQAEPVATCWLYAFAFYRLQYSVQPDLYAAFTWRYLHADHLRNLVPDTNELRWCFMLGWQTDSLLETNQLSFDGIQLIDVWCRRDESELNSFAPVRTEKFKVRFGTHVGRRESKDPWRDRVDLRRRLAGRG